MTEEELTKRAANLDKLPATTPESAANSTYKASETKPVLEKVEIKPKPELNPYVTPLEAFWAWIIGYAKQQAVNSFEGKPITSPFSILSVFTNWKILLIGFLGLGLLIALLRWIV